MTLTAFPNGASSFGMPILGGGGLMTTGNVFFVDSGAVSASAGNAATSPTDPTATIDQAIGKCTANNGDVIFVMPGHAENISSGTSLVVDVAGVSIIGLGEGRNRPVLTYTATAGSIEMDAANCRLSNMVLITSESAVVVGINVDANDIRIDHIEMNWDETGDDWVMLIDIDAVSRPIIEDCQFVGEATTGWANGIRLDTVPGCIIRRCHFSGQWTLAAIVGEDAASIDLLIADCTFYNADTSSANCVGLTAACTGLLSNNMYASLHTGLDIITDPGSCLSAGCMTVNATDEFAIDGGAVAPSTS